MSTHLKEWTEELANSIEKLAGHAPNYLIPTKWSPTETHKVNSGDDRLVIDVGGSTLRIAHVKNSELTNLHREIIPSHAHNDPIGWLVSTVQQHKISRFALSWSFPLKDGCLQPMGKGWRLPEHQIGLNLKTEINKRLGDNACLVVVHDAAGSLIAHNSANPDCKVALTWGTGINITYYKDGAIVNTEIGMAGRPPYGDSIPIEPFDRAIQKHTRGDMPLEYIIGGAYLGSIFSEATGIETETHQLWTFLERDHRADFIVERACDYVAAALYAVTKVLGGDNAIVSYTGGVICEPLVMSRLMKSLSKLAIYFKWNIELEMQRFGPEVGAAVVARGL